MINEQLTEQLTRQQLRVVTKLTKITFNALFAAMKYAHANLNKARVPKGEGIKPFHKLAKSDSELSSLGGEENPLNAYINDANLSEKDVLKTFNKIISKYGIVVAAEKENGAYTLYFETNKGVRLEQALKKSCERLDELKRKKLGLSTREELQVKLQEERESFEQAKNSITQKFSRKEQVR